MNPALCVTVDSWQWYVGRINAAIKEYEATPDDTHKNGVIGRVKQFQEALPKYARSTMGIFLEAVESQSKNPIGVKNLIVNDLREFVRITISDEITFGTFSVIDRTNAVWVAAKESPKDIPELMQSFGVESDSPDVEILSQVYFKGLSEADLKVINAKGEFGRFAFVFHLAEGFSHHMWDKVALFNLSPERRLKIVEIIVKQGVKQKDPWSIANFRAFAIPNEADRFRLARDLLSINPRLFANHIANFDLNEDSRVQVAVLAIFNDKSIDYKLFKITNVNSLLILMQLAEYPPERIAKECRGILDDPSNAQIACTTVAAEFAALQKEVAAIEDLKGRRKRILLLGYLDLLFQEKSAADRQAVLPLAREILAIQDIELGFSVIHSLATKGIPQIPAGASQGSHLFRMLFHPLQSDKTKTASTTLTPQEWETIFTHIERNGFGLQWALDFVTSKISVTNQIAALKSVLNKAVSKILTPRSALQLVTILLEGGRGDLLQLKPAQSGSEFDVKEGADQDLLMTVFDKLLGIKPTADFRTRYEATFGKTRLDHAVVRFAVSLGTVLHRGAAQHLNSIVAAIWEGRYHEMRYAMPAGSHLEKVFKGRDAQKWCTGEAVGLQSLDQPNSFQELSPSSAFPYMVVDTDDWENMMLIGHGLPNSCLKVDDLFYSAYILGCMADGKIRAIAIKKDGETIARCLFSILVDAEGRPVLVQHPVYTVRDPSPNVHEILNEMCKRRARALGLPLVRLKNGMNAPPQIVPYPKDLFSLGCPVPFENIDIGPEGSIKTKGKYTVPKEDLYFIDTAK